MKKQDLECLLDKAFAHLIEACEHNLGKFHVPTDKNNKPRISEQEFKLCFIETFIKESSDEVTYSVESPTENNYCFSKVSDNKRKSIKPEWYAQDSGKGRSGNIDVVIYSGKNKVALIEFKAHNADFFEHGKDFCKLEHEPGNNVLRYFVEILESTDSNTLDNLEDKLYKNEKYGNISTNTTFIGYSLHHEKEGRAVKIIEDMKRNLKAEPFTICKE